MSLGSAQPPTLAGHPAAAGGGATPPLAASVAAGGAQPGLDIPPAPLGLVALWDLWKKTTGTLSLDLSRRKMRGGAPGDSLWRVSAAHSASEPAGRKPRGRPPTRPQQPRYGAPPPGTYAAAGAYGGNYGANAPAYNYGLVDLPSLNFMDTGARFKLMRHVQFGPKVEVQRSSGLTREVPTFDLGVGLAFEVDTAELQPQARLKFRDLVSLKALPYPSLKIQKRLRWPDTTWGVRLSYECPLESLATFYRPPARLMMSIDNMHSNGVQLTQAGLEFNFAQLFGERRQAELRACGLVALPRELPIIEGQSLAGLELRRLGLKTQW
ncbi:hypothetical protein ABPG77_001725 [Micractinium sp. CCAP 211/92]